MVPTLTLRDAAVEDIQLELIRRTRFNSFDGERICELLARHRDCWRAAVFDRPGVPNYNQPGRLLVGGLIKLRDLEDNIWNADTLFVLTHTHDDARALVVAFDDSDTGAMTRVIDDVQEIVMAVGTFREGYGLLKVWWD